MFDPMLETEVRSRWTFPVSMLGHLLLVGLIVGASGLIIESVTDPKLPVIFNTLIAVPPSPPPPPPPRGRSLEAADAGPKLEQMVPKNDEVVQPREFEEDLPLVDLGAGGTGDAEGDPLGNVNGKPGGELDGIVGGVPGSLGIDRDPQVLTPEMTPPRLQRKLEPEYPEVARMARLTGSVILRAVISTEGRVEEIEVLRSSSPLFDDAAIAAVEQWQYEPARQSGRAVSVYFTIHVVFSLH